MRESNGWIAVAAALALAAAPATLEAQNQYRRWLGPITYTCTDLGGSVQVAFDNQDIEFNNLPADAQFTLNYMQNGVTTNSDGPFTVEQTSGTLDYGAFATSFAAYPARFGFRIDTLIDGAVVYSSTAAVTCTADATGPVLFHNVDSALLGDRWRRWSAPKTFTCSSVGGSVQVALDNQNVEFNNLPADAQFTINYIKNGVIDTDGPYTVEQTSGSRPYGAFATSFPGYPLSFIFRLDTLVDGVVVYQSSLDISCDGDTQGPAPIVDGAPPTAPPTLALVPALSPAMLGLLALLLGATALVALRRRA
jgi:hypothetical protein